MKLILTKHIIVQYLVIDINHNLRGAHVTMVVNIVALNALKRTKKIMINANPTRLIFLTLARRTVI